MKLADTNTHKSTAQQDNNAHSKTTFKCKRAFSDVKKKKPLYQQKKKNHVHSIVLIPIVNLSTQMGCNIQLVERAQTSVILWLFSKINARRKIDVNNKLSGLA